MNLRTTVKRLNDTTNVITKYITADNTPEEGNLALQTKMNLLRYVLDNPSLTDCGGSSFDVLTLCFTGLAWELTMKADVPNYE